jgi:hypothetical protein
MKKSGILILILFMIISCKTDKNESVMKKNDSEILKTNQAIDSSKNLIIINQKVEHSTEESNDTFLKGGFSIIYNTDNEDQYLIYKKGMKVIDTLNSCSIGLPKKNLGYVISDFDDTFIFGQSFGSGNPTVVQLYEKETGKNLIKEYSAIIDVDSTKQILLYSENDVPNKKDKMTLFDIKKRRKKPYEFPKEIFGEAEILNRIHITNITDKSFTIEYEFDEYNQRKQKKYIR